MAAPGFLSLAAQNGTKNGQSASSIRRDVIGGVQQNGGGIGAVQIGGQGAPGQSGRYGGINPGGMYGAGAAASGVEPSQEKAGQIGAGTRASGQAGRYGGFNPDGMYSGGPQGGQPETANQKQGEMQGGAIGESLPGGTPGQSGQYGGINPGGMYSGGLLQQAAGASAADPYINRETDTVEGRMNNLLSQDSDYMRRAATRGMQTAASRGLLNSSMAAGASQAASIDAALPIAQQDASTYSGFATRNQQFGQQQALDADKFAQERAIKQWEQDNLAYAQLVKGISDINMQDMSRTAKDQAIKNLWAMYQKARPISSSLSNVSIVDGKIVRGYGKAGADGVSAPVGGGASGGDGGGGTDGGASGGMNASGQNAESMTQKSYFDFKSTKEMPQWVRDTYKARYGDVQPQQARKVQEVLDFAKWKMNSYMTDAKFMETGEYLYPYAGMGFRSNSARNKFKKFIEEELKKVNLPADEKLVGLVATGPGYQGSGNIAGNGSQAPNGD